MGRTLSKAEAEELGVTITGDDLVLSDDDLAVSSQPEPTVKQETEVSEKSGKKSTTSKAVSKKK